MKRRQLLCFGQKPVKVAGRVGGLEGSTLGLILLELRLGVLLRQFR